MRISRILLALVGVVFLIVLIIFIFGGGSKKPNSNPIINALKPLPDYADTNAEVSLTNDGIVNGDELHRSIRVTVSNSSRVLDIIQGYSGTVIDSHNFYNTADAYSVFLKAINNYGFLSKQAKPKAPADPAGQCPLGFRYIYKLTQDGSDLSSTWSSSCGSAVGTSSATTSSLLTLFQDQIPNYSTLIQNVNLSATTTTNNQ